MNFENHIKMFVFFFFEKGLIKMFVLRKIDDYFLKHRFYHEYYVIIEIII